jgi:hypothetical protein
MDRAQLSAERAERVHLLILLGDRLQQQDRTLAGLITTLAAVVVLVIHRAAAELVVLVVVVLVDSLVELVQLARLIQAAAAVIMQLAVLEL